jgi:hypothetical protein
MAFKLQSTTGNNKQYLMALADAGPRGARVYKYITADTPATVATSGYITKATDGNHEIAYDMLSVGDLIYVFQVAAIDDTRTIEADQDAGITDISLHAVLAKSATVLDLSEDLLGATVTYTA